MLALHTSSQAGEDALPILARFLIALAGLFFAGGALAYALCGTPTRQSETTIVRQGRTHVFFGGPLLGLLNEGVLDNWERVAYERFAYDGMGAKGDGESAVYRKIAAQMTAADQQLHAKFGEPPQDWVAPIGWVDDGRAWLTWGEGGRIKIDTVLPGLDIQFDNTVHSPPGCLAVRLVGAF